MSISNLLKGAVIASASTTLLALGTGEKAQAAAAISFTSPTIDFTNDTWSLGFKFSTNTNFTVSSLGFYDDLKNDLTESHDVGIFDDLGNLLVSGTVNPGAPLDGWFRYTSVSPTLLPAGKTFFIAATTGLENYTWNPNGFAVDPSINFIQDAYVVSTTLAFPSGGPSGDIGYFGPNFRGEADQVIPTPALLPGLVGMGIAAYRKRKGELAQENSDA